MEMSKFHWIGIGIALAFIILSFFLTDERFLVFAVGIGIVIGATPFVLSLIAETKINAEKEEMFLEFARNLVESVKTGASISKSIVNLKEKSYGLLSPHVEKLANQIALGIPLNFALRVFARDVNTKSVTRAITLIGQAERAGGDIGEILEAVAEAVNVADKLKKERKSTISTLVVQGYIIFFVFMIIILVMQFQILPMLEGITNVGSELSIGGLGGGGIDPIEISNSFLYLLLIQGLFTGLTIGKLAEGNIKSGIRHSFTLMLISFLLSTGASLFL